MFDYFFKKICFISFYLYIIGHGQLFEGNILILLILYKLTGIFFLKEIDVFYNLRELMVRVDYLVTVRLRYSWLSDENFPKIVVFNIQSQ